MVQEILNGRYSISDSGELFSIRRQKTVKAHLDNNGYERVSLYDGSKYKQFRIHRLVAEEFIPNPENKRTVNHIDGNRSNNHVSNLEWSTDSENNLHAFETLDRKASRGKLSLEEVHDIMTCTSCAEDMAAKYPQVTAKHIRSMRKGKFIKQYMRSGLFSEEVFNTEYQNGNTLRRKEKQ